MNGCVAEFPKLSEALANGKESLQGALEEKKADLRSFKDDSLLVQPKRGVRKCPRGLGCGNPESQTTGLTLRDTFLQRFESLDE